MVVPDELSENQYCDWLFNIFNLVLGISYYFNVIEYLMTSIVNC